MDLLEFLADKYKLDDDAKQALKDAYVEYKKQNPDKAEAEAQEDFWEQVEKALKDSKISAIPTSAAGMSQAIPKPE